MTVLINASNTSGLTFTSDTSGNVAIQSNGTTVATISGSGANAGIQMGSTFAPTFSAYTTSNQTLPSSSNTLIQLPVEAWDTAGAFNNTGSNVTANGLTVPAYAFCPPVAGYYQVNASMRVGASATEMIAWIYKNGSGAAIGANVLSNQLQSNVGTIVYLNGTGDYIQFYGFVGTGQILSGSASGVYFNACYLRSA